MKGPCTWLLRTRASAWGALIGPDDQGLVAYPAAREAELAFVLREAHISAREPRG